MKKIQDNLWDERLVRHIIDSMADGVFILDAKGKIIFWNPAMSTISGYSEDEALGQTCALLACSRCFGMNCPADIDRCRIFEKGTSGAKECHLQHKHGHDVPVIKRASVVKDEQGEILGVVETITDLSELEQARRQAEEAGLKLKEVYQFDKIIGKSKEMQQVFRAIRTAAASDATVLIQGESGTGKELIAGAIHYNSGRNKKPLITVNCSALPENLLESELFGHIKGAYTGAIRGRIGRFEEAHEGTVFLDEIGELSHFIQVKLLRVLQEREIERVGESKRRKVNIRIVAATHRDLKSLVDFEKFREDLYYRLNVFPINVPPLRQRLEDIPLLVDHFINYFNTKTSKSVVDASNDVMRLLMAYHWPGNVRELENAIEHAFVLCSGSRLEKEDLPAHLHTPATPVYKAPENKQSRSRKTSGLDKEKLLEMLKKNNWNKSQVAKQLGVSHTAVWKYMKKWEIPLTPEKY